MRKLKRVRTHIVGESRTKQSFREETDIMTMLRRHGGIPPVRHPGRFIDATLVNDFFTAKMTLMQAEDAFGMLPAIVRDRFDNDPGSLVRTVDAVLGDPVGHSEVLKELVGLEILSPDLMEQFGIPAEPGDSPPVPPSPPASPPPAPES